MVRVLAALAGLLAIHAAEHVAAADGADAFRRGINISTVFTFPEEEGWPPFRGPKAQLADEELRALSEAGFDFIRLPIYPTPFDRAGPDGRRELMGAVGDFVRRANRAGLAVMVSGYATHSPTAWLPEHDGEEGRASFEDYASWLEDLSGTIDAVTSGRGAAIELMNEPQSVCINSEGTDWAEFQMALHDRVRSLTELPIVLTGGCWSTIDGLMQLSEVPDDPNTLYDVHYYEPFTYTHQGATWAGPTLAYVGGLGFPPQETDLRAAEAAILRLVTERHDGTAQEAGQTVQEAHAEIDRYLSAANWPRQIEEDFARLARWADRQGVAPSRIIIGEFGAIRPPREGDHARASRRRYLSAVRQAIEMEGFGWAMWEYFSPFGLLESDESRRLSTDVLEALGLEEAKLTEKNDGQQVD